MRIGTATRRLAYLRIFSCRFATSHGTLALLVVVCVCARFAETAANPTSATTIYNRSENHGNTHRYTTAKDSVDRKTYHRFMTSQMHRMFIITKTHALGLGA